MATLRTEETEQKYQKYKDEGQLANGCNLCDKAPTIKEFKYWKIVETLFPWDRIARVQHMIVPKRHVVYEDLNKKEKKEFDEIRREYIEQEYEIMAESTDRIKTIPQHFHVHLIVLKDKI